jgi:hypothetical protein
MQLKSLANHRTLSSNPCQYKQAPYIWSNNLRPKSEVKIDVHPVYLISPVKREQELHESWLDIIPRVPGVYSIAVKRGKTSELHIYLE